MTQEQKAAAYDEAIEKARIYYISGDSEMKTMMVTCFPELGESEDERIRKILIDHIIRQEHDFGIKSWYGFTTKDLVAWLEKQKPIEPPKDYTSIDPHFGKPINVQHFANSDKTCKDEQKPTEGNRGDNKGISPDELFEDALLHIIKESSEQELDEYIKNNLKTDAANLLLLAQKPAEWSEEDEKIISNIEVNLNELNHRYGRAGIEKQISWLKSLHPQNHWKPTEGQMKALNKAINLFDKDIHPISRADLLLLYNNLEDLQQ